MDTYTSALRQALLASTPDELLVDAVERRLNALAAKRKSGSSATALISGVRLLEKLRIIQAVVTEVRWMQARAIGKGWARRAQPKPVATWDHVETITTSRGHWAWGRLVFLAICSIVYLWRVGDAASVTWEWISVPGFVTFWDEKRNKKVTTYALSPFLEAWRAYLWKHRPGHVQVRQPLVPGGRSVLQTVLQQVVQHRDLPKAAWHGLKKPGAVSLGHQGGKLRGLQVWGRWWSQASPDITGRHRQDGHYQQKSTCHGRWGTADGWPEMWRGDWSNPSHSGPRMHGRQCRRSQQPCSLGGTGTTPNHRETTLTPPAPARQMRGQMRQTRKRQRQSRWSRGRNSMMSLKERRDRRSRRVWMLRLRTPRWSQLPMTLLLQQATADLLRSMWYTLWSMTRMMVVTQLVIWGQTLRRRRRRTTRQPDTSGNAMATTCLTAPSGHAGENVKVEASRLCGNPNPTQPHTLGMWSQRLGEVHSTSCGDLCRCTALAQMKCPECEALVTDHWLQASKKVAETIRVKEQTVRDLLRDYMMTTMCRWNEEAGPVSRHLGAVLHELATNVEAATDISPPDISTSSSRRHRSKLVVPVEVAEKGLGDTGAIDIPDSVWDAMAPANFLRASEGTPPPTIFIGPAVGCTCSHPVGATACCGFPVAKTAECKGVCPAQE